MPLNIIVCAAQVMDPETPMSAFRIDPEKKRVVPPQGIPPVVNGFDENAMEAALRLKEQHGGKVTVLSLGNNFVSDVIKKPLAMGGDELILLQGSEFEDLDAFPTAKALTAAIQKIGEYDLILCGRQASEWDQAHVPHGIAEQMGLPIISMAADVQVNDGTVRVVRKLGDGQEALEAPLPAVVTVSNELAPVRYPTLRNIMQASRKKPTEWTASDAGVDSGQMKRGLELEDLVVPVSDRVCEFIEGEDEEDAGRKLAQALREAKLI